MHPVNNHKELFKCHFILFVHISKCLSPLYIALSYILSLYETNSSHFRDLKPTILAIKQKLNIGFSSLQSETPKLRHTGLSTPHRAPYYYGLRVGSAFDNTSFSGKFLEMWNNTEHNRKKES